MRKGDYSEATHCNLVLAQTIKDKHHVVRLALILFILFARKLGGF